MRPGAFLPNSGRRTTPVVDGDDAEWPVGRVRPGTLGSGSAGGGFEMRFDKGFYFRLQGSYDCIGVIGLDVWSRLICGGITFKKRSKVVRGFSLR